MRHRLYLLAFWACATMTALSLGAWVWSGFASALYRWQGGMWMIGTGELFVSAAPSVRWNPAVLGFEYQASPTGPLLTVDSKLRFRSLSEYDLQLPHFVPALVFGAAASLTLYRVRKPFDRPGRVSRRGSFRALRWTLAWTVLVFLAASFASEWTRLVRNRPSWSVCWRDGKLTLTSGTYWSLPEAPSGWSLAAVGDVEYEAAGIHLFALWTPSRSGSDEYGVSISTWGLAALLAFPASMLWYIHLRKYPASSRCRKCHYDLTGLAAGAPCPECGSATQSRPTTLPP